METHGLDALIVSGSEYSGFEGAVTYMSGFQIVHRYAYVVAARRRRPVRSSSPPRRATSASTGRRRSSRCSTRARASTSPPTRAAAGWKRIGVYGLDYIMAVRDYQALDGLELVPFDVEFDLARAVKSEAELESVRDSVRINQRGFEIWHEAYAPGKTAAEVMAAAEEWFVAEGCGRLTMNMVLTGTDTYARPEFKIARSDEVLRGFVLPSLEVAGRACTGSRSHAPSAPPTSSPRTRRSGCWRRTSSTTRRRKTAMRAGATCHDVHTAVSKGFTERGYHLGHVTGHSIGMTMIEFPKVGEGSRRRAAGEHGPLDAPPRDRRERRGLPLHAGHVARDAGGRRPAGRPRNGDLGAASRMTSALARRRRGGTMSS